MGIDLKQLRKEIDGEKPSGLSILLDAEKGESNLKNTSQGEHILDIENADFKRDVTMWVDADVNAFLGALSAKLKVSRTVVMGCIVEDWYKLNRDQINAILKNDKFGG